jgi:hypothetical protein
MCDALAQARRYLLPEKSFRNFLKKAVDMEAAFEPELKAL